MARYARLVAALAILSVIRADLDNPAKVDPIIVGPPVEPNATTAGESTSTGTPIPTSHSTNVVPNTTSPSDASSSSTTPTETASETTTTETISPGSGATNSSSTAPTRLSNWAVKKTYQGDDFYNSFDFVTFDDPTNGRTNYLDQQTAKDRGLAWVNNGQFGMAVDSTNVVDSSARGRDSVRIQSHDYFAGDMLIIADIAHMPEGCSTWPAFWTIGTGEWPSGGEIDIIEGNNDLGTNLITVHTGNNAQCTMPWSSGDLNQDLYTATPKASTCDGGAGCNFVSSDSASFGPGFNAAGGGYYILRRTSDYIAAWFYPRTAEVPSIVSNPGDTFDETQLGTMTAYFPNTKCDLANDLTEQQLIFNIAMCGGWAESGWASSPCKSKWGDCSDYVNNHPEGFKGAYWLINDVRVYGTS